MMGFEQWGSDLFAQRRDISSYHMLCRDDINAEPEQSCLGLVYPS